jgi:hypothetical protein
MIATATKMTDKQAAFLKTLFSKVYGENAPEALLAWLEAHDCTPTAKQASAQITALLNTKTTAASTVTIPDGIHFTDGSVYRVRHAKTSGKQYAERLLTQIEREENDGKQWLYEASKPLVSLSADTLLTLAQARAFGHAYGVCAVCGRLLEDPDSVEAGIGPVCAKKF